MSSLMYLFKGLTRREMRSRYPAMLKDELKTERSPENGGGWNHGHLSGNMGMSCRHWISLCLEPPQAPSLNLPSFL